MLEKHKFLTHTINKEHSRVLDAFVVFEIMRVRYTQLNIMMDDEIEEHLIHLFSEVISDNGCAREYMLKQGLEYLGVAH